MDYYSSILLGLPIVHSMLLYDCEKSQAAR